MIALASVAVAALTLTGCLSSPRKDVFVFRDGYGIERCAVGNSIVGEQADLDDGKVPFGGQTEVRKDAYCGNEEPSLYPFWDQITVNVALEYYEDGTWHWCGNTNTSFSQSTSVRQVISADVDRCGDRYYRAAGRHQARTYYESFSRTEYSYTGATFIDL